MKHITHACLIVICMAVLAGCKAKTGSSQDLPGSRPAISGSKGPSSPEMTPSLPADLFEIAGTVAYMDIEGGFYAIHGEDGRKYAPVNLPEAYRRDGLTVNVTARLKTDTVGVHMYGAIIEIVSIETP